VVEASSGEPRRITDLRAASQEPEPIAIDSDPLRELNRSFRERSRSGVSQVVWTPSGEALVFAFKGRLHRVSAEGGTPEILVSARASRSDLSYSPDGRRLSWIQEEICGSPARETPIRSARPRSESPPSGSFPAPATTGWTEASSPSAGHSLAT
jgi:hypothetical protein